MRQRQFWTVVYEALKTSNSFCPGASRKLQTRFEEPRFDVPGLLCKQLVVQLLRIIPVLLVESHFDQTSLYQVILGIPTHGRGKYFLRLLSVSGTEIKIA